MSTAIREHFETLGHTLERQRVVTNGGHRTLSRTTELHYPFLTLLPRLALLIGGLLPFYLGSLLLCAFCGVILHVVPQRADRRHQPEGRSVNQ